MFSNESEIVFVKVLVGLFNLLLGRWDVECLNSEAKLLGLVVGDVDAAKGGVERLGVFRH